VILVASLDAGAGAEIVTWPMILAGLGIGALARSSAASQSPRCPTSRARRWAAFRTRSPTLAFPLARHSPARLIAALTSSLLTGVQQNPAVAASVKSHATTELASGVPFISDAELKTALEQANVPPETANAIVEENENARLVGLRAALSVLAIVVLIALVFSRRLPNVQPGSADREDQSAAQRSAAATLG
jgi:hypothetical protein